MDFLFPTCTVCGVPVRDTALHQRFHDGLREVCRKLYAPDMTPEEYAQAVELAGIGLALNEIAETEESP